MKTSVWAVTIFFTAYFAAPHTNAAWINPTNYSQFQKAVPVSEANIVQQTPEVPPDSPNPDQPKGKIWAPVIFFIIVLAVVAYIVYQLIKLLDKVLPPPDKKPDPPPQSGNTNYPPVVINPLHGPGPAIADLKTKSLTIDSNTPSWGPVQCYDIANLNYENTMEKFQARVDYDTYWSVGMTLSTDLLHWEDSHYRIDCYACTVRGAVFYAYYHYDTNFWNCYYTSSYVATNHQAPAWFDLSDRPYKPQQYFRLDPK